MPAGASKSKAVPKGQKSISSFFGGAKTKADSSDAEMAPSRASDDDEEMEVEDRPTTTRTATKGKGVGKTAAPDSSDLPPINQIPDMFADMIKRVPQIKSVVEHVQGRKLRVATMCSGTESPLLALELIQKSIQDQHGLTFEIEHVFSCEIEPFKQAYIERNFHPPILFRDVCELGNERATTAYGAKATVPGDVDLLVAGTSCVDYSNLNNEKQDIDGSGESGRTFRGMMSWVRKHRPPIVILENVCSAPWARVQKYFEKNGYSAGYTRVDTKLYYIPHTRTRVYLIAVNEKLSKMPDSWKDWLTSKLKRPASASLDLFLLTSDDSRIHEAREKLVRENYNALDRRTGRTDWGRCESRHQRARLEEELGSKRPLTSWDEGGFCKLPDFAWQNWGVGQVERVWDLMDITHLRSAVKGVDPSYKTLVWNLSQNVDRTIGSSKVGICPCLTPSMIPYITNRGGPMVGLEALSMQGLPVDKLLLTRETEDQLADLAGNAMSTTVVGACMLAALIVGKKLLKAGNDDESYENKAGDDAQNSEEDSEGEDDGQTNSRTALDAQPTTDDLDEHIVGEQLLHKKPLDFASASEHSLKSVLSRASKSARLCSCEGRKGITTQELLRCQDCGTSSCKKCGGRPEHNPEPIDVISNARLSPLTFAKELKSTLPMCLSLKGITEDLLETLKDKAVISIPEKRWSPWRDAVLRACKFELRFAETKRQEIWTVIFRSPTAYIELNLHPQQPEWRLFAKPEDHEPANAEIREILEHPIARLSALEDLFTGRWEIALPHSTPLSITIEGVGDPVPAWEARLGLLGDGLRDKLVYAQLKISLANSEANNSLDRDITGTYSLLDKCGTANGALHRKTASSKDASLPPLFFLLDPHRCKEEKDSFVFSISMRRYEYGEARPIICRLDPKWRQSTHQGAQNVTCYLPCKWAVTDRINLEPSHLKGSSVSVPGKSFTISVSDESCRSANALLVCHVPLHSQAGPEWPVKVWKEVDKVHERSTFQGLAWLLEPVRYVDDTFNAWQSVDMSHEFTRCERCAPTAPALEWRRVNKKDVAFENSVQAGEYERRLKRRPTPFVTQLKLDENGVGTVRLGVNIPSLIHRALSRLPSAGRTEKPIVSWRLNTDFIPLASLSLPKFVLSSNKLDPEHSQPPSFKIPLRKEQLRSLHWMLQQEANDAPPFVEEEISEAILGPLGWRAEGRAQRPVHIKGGVLADQVGYGKTAITLGLIDCTAKIVAKEFSKLDRMEGKIPVKATLIVVPPHLTKQWDSECRKFAGKRFKTAVLSTATSVNSLTIEQVQEADIVIVASSLFKSSVYLDNLEALAAGATLPAQDGRYFNDRLEATLNGLRIQTDRLQDEGSDAVMKRMREFRRDEAEAAVKAEAEIASKRLKGKSYRVANAKDSTKEEPFVSRKFKGPTMEVVITKKPIKSFFQKTTQRSRPASSTEGEDVTSDSDGPILPKKRAVKQAAIVISDDDEDMSQSEQSRSSKKVPKKNGVQKAKWKSKPPPSSASSDYEQSSAEESDDEEFEQDVSDSDDIRVTDKQKSKYKQAPKVTPKSKNGSSRAVSSKVDSDEDGMDVDEPTSSKSAGKKPVKRKATDDKPAAKKQKRREDTDPWKLESAAIKRDWTLMQAPALEMFHFARVVVDEYTYLDSKAHALVTRLTADRKWVLSGTPPIHDFAALKTISAFLDVHLGVDDDGEGQSAQVKKRRREQTESEKFHSFREVHSLEWHAHRHEIGQTFLDRFVRQNIAEIDEIPWTEKVVEVVLPAAERAIYLELEHHLRALDMTIKRGKKTESDREKRLAKSLGESSTAEEALLKRCSHFDLDTSNDNAMKACDVIVQERQKQLDECKQELLKCLIAGVKREASIGRVGEESMFREYVRVSRTEGVGDKDATEIVVDLLDKAGATASHKSAVNGKNKTKEDGDLPTKVKDQIWEHREKTHDIRRLTKELVGRVRSLRYFTVVRDLQRQSETPPVISCPSCNRENIPVSDIAVLSSCGHTGCLDCVKTCAEKEECVYAASDACKSAARVLNVVKGDTLGVDESREGRGKHYGMKLEKVIDLIKNQIPKDERVLIFVQFPDLMKKLAEALTAHKVRFLEIKGTATQKSNNLEKYQNDSAERVLLLNVMDESASGANLTSANHAIFLSPLLALTKEIYDANETQAVGRLVRYGQVKHVYVWRFLTKNTIDEEIYQQRAKDKKI